MIFLEEYYTGSFVLPNPNGVTDGSVIMITIFIFTGFKGSDFWNSIIAEEGLFGYGPITMHHTLLYSVIVLGISQIGESVYMIMKHKAAQDDVDLKKHGGYRPGQPEFFVWKDFVWQIMAGPALVCAIMTLIF